jgi:hypothetical protein
MIIVLDQSLVDGLASASAEREQILAALSICAQQAREGNHIILGDRATFGGLTKYYSEMDLRTKSTLQRASEKLAVRMQIRDFAKIAVRIVSITVTQIPIKRASTDGKQEILLPAFTIDTNSSIVGKPALLVENINDGKVYLRLVRSLANKNLLPGLAWLKEVRLSCDIMPGGGNTLCDLFDLRYRSGDRIGLAVADSDYRYRGSELGDTAKRLLTAASREPKSPLLEVLTLAVRTIENCIPAAETRSIMEELDPDQAIRFQELFSRFYRTRDWYYVPIKSGVKCFELGRSTAESMYWTSLLGERQCSSGDGCSTKKECETYVLEPISSQLLARAGAREYDFQISDSCGQELIDEWERLAILFYSYFCGELRTLGR